MISIVRVKFQNSKNSFTILTSDSDSFELIVKVSAHLIGNDSHGITTKTY